MDHETGSQAPARSSNFGEQLQKLNEKWSDDIKIDTSVGNNDEPTTERPVVLRRSDELGETRVVAALLTPQSGCSYGQVLEAVKKTRTAEYCSLGKSLWDYIDNQAYDAGVLALLFPGNKS